MEWNQKGDSDSVSLVIRNCIYRAKIRIIVFTQVINIEIEIQSMDFIYTNIVIFHPQKEIKILNIYKF